MTKIIPKEQKKNTYNRNTKTVYMSPCFFDKA